MQLMRMQSLSRNTVMSRDVLLECREQGSLVRVVRRLVSGTRCQAMSCLLLLIPRQNFVSSRRGPVSNAKADLSEPYPRG